MIPLLADTNTQDYDIIAIQEAWRNPSAPTSLSSHQSGFYLLYRPGSDTRVCFYVNDLIDNDSWELEFTSADMCILKIKTYTEGVMETFMSIICITYLPPPIHPLTVPRPYRRLGACLPPMRITYYLEISTCIIPYGMVPQDLHNTLLLINY